MPTLNYFISMGGQGGATVVGWADVLSSNPLNGFAIFRQMGSNGTASEGTVPLESRISATIIVPFDDTGSYNKRHRSLKMHAIGLPALFAAIAAIGLLLFAFIFFCIWKFYRMLSAINDNLDRIRQAVESASLLRW